MDDIERLQNWLDEHHLSASQFARELGYSISQISLILNRHRPLSDRLRWQFSRRYGVDEAQAVFGKKESAS